MSSNDDGHEAAHESRTKREPIQHGPKKTRFEEIFRDGKRVSGVYCRISAIPGKGLIGWATSKKIGCTPRRNKVKRRFRDALRSQDLCIECNLDYVVVISSTGANASYEEAGAELRALFERVALKWAEEPESS